FQLTDSVGREELASHSVLGQLPSYRLGTILAELEGTGMPRIRPSATGTVKAIGLVHRQQRLGAFEYYALLAQRVCSGTQGTPPARGGIVRREHGCGRLLIEAVGRRGGDGRLLAHDFAPLNRFSSALPPQVRAGEVDQ